MTIVPVLAILLAASSVWAVDCHRARRRHRTYPARAPIHPDDHVLDAMSGELDRRIAENDRRTVQPPPRIPDVP